jgi:hypothetical protein
MDFFFVYSDNEEDASKKPAKELTSKNKTGCWAIDYIPDFSTIALPDRILEPFKNYIVDKEIPYSINIQGASGTGKWTLIRLMMWSCFNIDIETAYKTTECEHLWYSGHVFMVDFSSLTNSEAIATIKYLTVLSRQSGFAGTYKILLLKNIDTITKSTQLGLCKVYDNCVNVRIISTSTTYNASINENMKSRISLMTLRKMSPDEIKAVCRRLLASHNAKLAVDSDIIKVYNATEYSLRDTILIIQNLATTGERFKGSFLNQHINECLTLCFSSNIGNPDIYTKITQKLYSILTVGIPAITIFRLMIKKLINHPEISHEQKFALMELSGKTSHNLAIGDKPVFHLEKACYEILAISNKINLT